MAIAGEKLAEFLEEHKGIILGNLDSNLKEGDTVVFAYLGDRLYYLQGGAICNNKLFEPVSKILTMVYKDEACIVESVWFSEEFYPLYNKVAETLCKISENCGRSRLTGSDLSSEKIAGIDDNGKVLVSAEGLRGTNSGVNVYSELVNEVTVGSIDIENSGIKVIDMSRCNQLRRFKLGKENSASITVLDSVVVIFPNVIGDTPFGVVALSTRELKLVGADRVIFDKLAAVGCLFSVDGELSVKSCYINECKCGSELRLRLINGGSSDDSRIVLKVLDIEKLFIRADSLMAWKDKRYLFRGLNSLRVIDIEVNIEGYSVVFGEFIDYIFDNEEVSQHPSVYEIRIKFIGGNYLLGDKGYLMRAIFPSLKRLTICGNKKDGNEKNLIVPSGCEVVYQKE